MHEAQNTLAAFGGSLREAAEKSAACGDVATSNVFTAGRPGVDQQLRLLGSHQEMA
jgi:hypothetical protein